MDPTLRSAALTLCLCFAGCHCDRREHAIEPSTDTVDPATHEPYQPKLPNATGNPMSDTESVPDQPAPPEHPGEKEQP